MEHNFVEEHRVVAQLGIESELAGDAHRDETGANRVADRLPFREIQRVRQRGEHLGEMHAASQAPRGDPVIRDTEPRRGR